MTATTKKLIDRPRLAKPKPREEYWLVLDPHRTGMVGGALAGWLAAIVYGVLALARWEAVFGPPQLVSVALSFVVGYAGTGIFVLYLLRVGEREFPLPEDDRLKRKKKREAAEALALEEFGVADASLLGDAIDLVLPDDDTDTEPETIPEASVDEE